MAIAVQISARWRIISDDYNVIIQCFRHKKWEDAAYHPNLASACQQMQRNLVFASNAETLQELIAAEDRAAQKIADALAGWRQQPKDEPAVKAVACAPARKPKPPTEGVQLVFFGEEMTA